MIIVLAFILAPGFILAVYPVAGQKKKTLPGLLSFLLIILASYCFTSPAFGAPAVTNVSGTIIHGQNIIISGSSFGVKNPAAPIRWVDFENGIIGNRVTELNNFGTSNIHPSYDSDQGRGAHSTKACLHDFLTNNQYGAYLGLGNISTYGNTFFVSFYGRVNVILPTDNYKIFGLRTGASFGDSGNPQLRLDLHPSVNDGQFNMASSLGSPIFNQWGMTDISSNMWGKYEFYISSGDLGVSNGFAYYWYNGALRTSMTGLLVRDSSSVFNNIYIQNFYRTDKSIGGGNARAWTDDVYIDNTSARIVLCDNNIYDSASFCELQIPSAWSDSSITATINSGNFPDTGTAYLFVFDADNNHNATGYPVTLGGTADVTPPASPTGLTVQ